jgi:hypothetical protein
MKPFKILQASERCDSGRFIIRVSDSRHVCNECYSTTEATS